MGSNALEGLEGMDGTQIAIFIITAIAVLIILKMKK